MSVSEHDLEQQFDEQFEPQDEPQEPQLEEEPQEPTEQLVRVGEQDIPVSRLEPYVRFMEWANRNPGGWEELVKWESGENVLVPSDAITYDDDDTPQQEEDDEFLDPEVARLKAELDELRNTVFEAQNDSAQRAEIEHRASFGRGFQAFVSDKGNLSEQDLERILMTARDNRLVETYCARDPYNQPEAVRRALEAAYRIEFFDRSQAEAGRRMASAVRNGRRAASGNGRTSQPRSAPDPQSPDEHFAAMVAAIKEARES